jgi:hypothetical protein
MDNPSFIIPHQFTSSKHDAELAAGHEGSAVLVKKIGVSSVSWPIDTSEIENTMYPSGQLHDAPTIETSLEVVPEVNPATLSFTGLLRNGLPKPIKRVARSVFNHIQR